MKTYKDYTTDEFIADEKFVRWVKFPEPELESFWTDFTANNPEKLSEINEAIQFLNLFSTPLPELPTDKLSKLHDQITERLDLPVSASVVHQIIKSRSNEKRSYAYAAVFTVILIALTSWWIMKPVPRARTNQLPSSQAAHGTTQLEEHVIPKGERSRIILDDGTQVWVNAGSKLEYANNFLENPTREVYLKGEAYFDVTPDASRPFVVHVQGVDIKVLGTSFNVKGYDEEPKIEATLVHGKISISSDSIYDHVTLAANQRAVFLKEKNRMFVENNVETDTYTSWRKGVLVFEDQPLREILPILERTFNVAIHTEDAHSLNCRFTAKIENKSLKEVLDLFRASDTIGYTIDNSDVYIHGSFCED